MTPIFKKNTLIYGVDDSFESVLSRIKLNRRVYGKSTYVGLGKSCEIQLSDLDVLFDKIEKIQYINRKLTVEYFRMFAHAVDRESTFGIRMGHMEFLFNCYVTVWLKLINEKNIQYVIFTNIPHLRWSIALMCACEILCIKYMSFMPTIDKNIKGVSLKENFFDYTSVSNLNSSYFFKEKLSYLLNLAKKQEYFYSPDNSISAKTISYFKIISVRFTPIFMMYVWVFFSKLLSGKNIIKHPELSLDFSAGEVKQVHELLFIRRLKLKLNFLSKLKKEIKLELNDNAEFNNFVYFPLHYQPEATTVPLAIDVSDQVTLAHELAGLLENYNIKLVVKEHPSTFNPRFRADRGRFKGYYKFLNSHKNIELVGENVDTSFFMEHSKFLFTISGTSALEKVVTGGVSVIMASHFAENIPNMHRVESIDKMHATIHRLLSDLSPEKKNEKESEDLSIVLFDISKDSILFEEFTTEYFLKE